MGGERRLDEKAVDLVVGVELGDNGEQLLLRDLRRQPPVHRVDPGLASRLLLERYVDVRGGIVADEDGRKADAAEARATSSATCSRTRAASALPSITLRPQLGYLDVADVDPEGRRHLHAFLEILTQPLCVTGCIIPPIHSRAFGRHMTCWAKTGSISFATLTSWRWTFFGAPSSSTRS